MFGFTKVVKLVGLFRRNPSDIMFLPVSILFGYFHGLIKLWALFTLKEVINAPFPPAQDLRILTASYRRRGGAAKMATSTILSVSRRSCLAARAWRRRSGRICQRRCGTITGSRKPGACPSCRRSTNSRGAASRQISYIRKPPNLQYTEAASQSEAVSPTRLDENHDSWLNDMDFIWVFFSQYQGAGPRLNRTRPVDRSGKLGYPHGRAHFHWHHMIKQGDGTEPGKTKVVFDPLFLHPRL